MSIIMASFAPDPIEEKIWGISSPSDAVPSQQEMAEYAQREAQRCRDGERASAMRSRLLGYNGAMYAAILNTRVGK